VNKLHLYILLLLCILSLQAFSADEDKIAKDTSGRIEVRNLPENFKEKYDGDEFVYEYDNQNDGLTWSERLSQWLLRVLMKIFNFEPTQKSIKIISFIIKALYFVALATLLYFIIRAILRKEGYRLFNKKQVNIQVLTGNLETNLLETDFDKLISEAVKTKSYNLATRYYYLKTLKVLSEKGIIEWNQDKTNSDYFDEMKNSQMQQQFQYISYIYNYCWYGEFDLSVTAWNQAESEFQSFLKSVI
jgi:hypothetical protein